MRTRLSSLLACLLGAATLSACGAKVTQIPNSTAATAYTPQGCSYQVTVPPGVEDAYYPAQTPLATTAPIHIHASFPSDPSQGFAVNWAFAPTTAETAAATAGKVSIATDTVALNTQLFYGKAEADVTAAQGATGTVTVQNGHTVRYQSVDENGSNYDTRIHEAHVCGLQPATTYYYKVGNPGAFSKTYALMTAPAPGFTGEYKFAVSGDARDNPGIWTNAESAVSSSGAVFQMFSGDVVNIDIVQTEWDAFFAASDVAASIPIMTANGNHDEMAINYLEEFALPQNMADEESAAQGGKEWYSFNYGNAHFAVLNDTTDSAAVVSDTEKTWLDNDLTAVDATKIKWTFVFHHMPEYTCTSQHQTDGAAALAAWGPIYDKHHVDIVFNGHVHSYQRSLPIKNGMNASDPSGGTIYIVSGAVGAPLYSCTTPLCSFSAACQSVNNYGIVDITGNTLKFTAYDVDTGSVLDTLSITKS